MAEKNIPRKEHFQQAYAGKAPWDIGKARGLSSTVWDRNRSTNM